jgi:DNA-binding MarR family transcriptional regulator
VLTADLAERGLLVLQQGRGDHRTRWALLSEEGQAMVRRIGDRLRATSPLLSQLDDDDRAQLALLLSRLDPLPASEEDR